MFKRLQYISRVADDLKNEDLTAIEVAAQRHNASAGITGVLVRIGDYFFQVLEGPADAVDDIYSRILIDPRHKDVVMVGKPERSDTRAFRSWFMRIQQSTERSSEHLVSLGLLVDQLLEVQRQGDRLAIELQAAVLRELGNPS